jgi:hypothetical protein
MRGTAGPMGMLQRLVAVAAGAMLVGPLVGCGSRAVVSPSPPSQPQAEQTAAMPTAVREQLLDGAMSVLGRLDDYDESSAASQVFDRLNQWSHGSRPPEGWHPDPLLDSLPARLRQPASAESLASLVFSGQADVMALRDRRWLADIAAHARGDAVDDLGVAVNLFRWTVRSLAIGSDPPQAPTAATPGTRWFLPGEILLAGRGSAAQRSWVFLELLRQAGLDGVMLGTGGGAGGGVRGWLPALISGGEAYLFEPAYGLPVPGPGGDGVATARQAAADPEILRGLSFPDRPYPVQASDVARLTVLVCADPWSLSRRMQLLEEHLAGARSIDLSVDATALAARAAAALPGADAADRIGLWDFPWEVLLRRREDAANVTAAIRRELAVMSIAFEQSSSGGRRGGQTGRIVRPLQAARVREFRGDLEGPDGAKAAYLSARPGNATIAAAVAQAAPEQAEAMKRLYEQMKEDATYWLGVLTLAEKDYATAVDYLDRMTLQAHPDGPWVDAARTNLAQALIEMGRPQDAVKLLRADPSPQRFGSRLLADRLEREVRHR